MRNPIDFEKPSHQLDEVLFNVLFKDVFTTNVKPDGTISSQQKASNYKAVVNSSNGQILSVVGNNYQLISNEEALEMGKDIFTQLYPFIKRNDLIPYKIVAPQTMASVHIDLIHKDVNFNVWDQETWLPFLRTTNSYNRTYALSFEVGFVRKLCSNGVLFDKKTMKIKYYHTRENKIRLESDVSHIMAAKGTFTKQCQQLKDFYFPQKSMIPMVFKAFNINLETSGQKQSRQKAKNLSKLMETTIGIVDFYSKTIGENAYSALNVLTDLVSHQDVNKCLPGYYLSVKSYFTRPTQWMDEFSVKIADQKFDLSAYLSEEVDKLKVFSNVAGLNWNLN